MGCDALSLEVLSKSDGLPKLSERELWACLAYSCAQIGGLTSSTGETAIASFKLAALDERSLLAVFLTLVSNNATATTVLASATTDKLQALSERDLIETIVASAIGSATASTTIANAMAAGMDQLSRRDLLAICVASLGSGSASTMLAAAYAAGYAKLSERALLECLSAIICANGLGNLVPGGAGYGPGNEFDLVVLANTQYQITWGAHDLSMTLCGVSYPSLGVGQVTIVNTGACALMQFFGTFANTTVTVMLRIVPVPSQVPVPTNFTWVISGANAVATWDSPPAGVISTELWTSTDNSTFTLAATVTKPGVTASVTAPGNGVTLYAKIRFTAKGYPGAGVFTATLNVSGTAMVVVNNWVSRVAVNGGTAPTAGTQAAAMNFVTTLVMANIWAKMVHVNIIAFESLMTAKTPLLVGGGNDPWVLVGGPPTSTSIIAQGLSMSQSGTSAAWNTGVQASVAFAASLTSMGMTFVKSASAGGTVYDSGGRDANGNTIELHSRSGSGPTLGWGQAWQGVAVMNPSLGTPAGVGFNSFSRINANRIDYYFADGATPCASVGNSVAADVGTASVSAIYLSHRDDAGTMDVTRKSSDTYSFFAIHKGLTATETATLFSAVQTLRTAMGGGTV